MSLSKGRWRDGAHSLHSPRMGNIPLTDPRPKANQLAAVDAEQLDDAAQRVGDGAVDLRGRQVDEARRQFCQQPFEPHRIVGRRGRVCRCAARFRFEHREV